VEEAHGPVQPTLSLYAQRIKPYDATSSLAKIANRGGAEESFKLDWNETTIAPSPLVMEALARFLSGQHHINWYPDTEATVLRERISEYVGLPSDHILVTNGSDDALDLVCRTYVDPRDQVLAPKPTYTHFLVFAGQRGAQITSVFGETPFVRNDEGILSSIGYNTKLIYLVSPNNPTGIVYPVETVRAILEAAPHAVVIVDEAYFEFAGETVVELVRQYSNLVVTRTFSKAFGIAGVRVGYAMAQPSVIADLKRLHNPKSVNALGQVAAAAALEDRAYMERYVAEVTQAKQMLVDFFTERGILCRTTPANYVLVRVPDAGRFSEMLSEQGIYIRDRSSIPQMRNYVRMSVGTREQTRVVCERIDRVLLQMPRAV
jgi:histidinol-phosphate aminotransferase